MQIYKKESKYYLLLLIVLLLAYLPISTLHFAMKNDAFSDNFPDKYLLSQALHSGVFALWNPYMNFGFPIYADPGFAFWNPITWFFAAMGYSAYTLTIEVLLYIYLAGIFMFRLGKWLQFSLPVAFIVACMYMCSGFFIGSIQYINFITGAAFLPLLIQSFLQLVDKSNLSNAAMFALSFACVAAGGHPAIPIGAVYMLIVLFISIVLFQPAFIKNFKSFLLFLLISMFLFLLIASPALYSYASIWNVYGRNAPQQDFEITNIGFSVTSLISFLFPFATTAHTEFFNNDVAMRNAYFSLPGLTGIFFAFKTKKKLVYSFLVTAFVMFVLCLGGDFKESLYKHLPFLNYVRTNGEYRVFVILLLCLVSGFGLSHLINYKKEIIKLRYILKYFIAACLLLIIGIGVLFRNEISTFFTSVFNQHLAASFIKDFYKSLNFSAALIVSLTISIVISLFIVSSKKLSVRSFIILIIIDLSINAFLCLPVTGVGTITVKQVQSFYNSNPAGIPIPSFTAIKDIDTLSEKLTGLVGSASYYNKKIGTTKLTDYPSYFKSTDEFFKSSYKDNVLSKPYLFLLKDQRNQSIKVTYFSPQRINIRIQSTKNDSLVFLQNNYRFWQAFNNGKHVPISTAFNTFISIPVSPGLHSIQLMYKDSSLLYYCCLSLLTLIIIGLIVLKKPAVNNNHTSTTSVLLK